VYEGKPVLATVLDHFKPERLWPDLFDSPSNHVPMCTHHHAIKSGLEKGVHSKERWLNKVYPKYKELVEL